MQGMEQRKKIEFVQKESDSSFGEQEIVQTGSVNVQQTEERASTGWAAGQSRLAPAAIPDHSAPVVRESPFNSQFKLSRERSTAPAAEQTATPASAESAVKSEQEEPERESANPNEVTMFSLGDDLPVKAEQAPAGEQTATVHTAAAAPAEVTAALAAAPVPGVQSRKKKRRAKVVEIMDWDESLFTHRK